MTQSLSILLTEPKWRQVKTIAFLFVLKLLMLSAQGISEEKILMIYLHVLE